MPGCQGNEPPLFHAELIVSPDRKIYTYQYDGTDLITIRIAGDEPLQVRKGSDGDMMSTPFHQQAYLTSPVEQTAEITFCLSEDSFCMRPHRALHEAIIGQVGRPLIFGVNGLYDVDRDLLISWHDRPCAWLDEAIILDAGQSRARLQVMLGPEPWILLLRMQYYRQHLGFIHYQPWAFKPDRRGIAGWCSWEAYHRQVSKADIQTTARFMSSTFGDYGLAYIQIDDGYQSQIQPRRADGSYASAFLETEDAFPDGHAGIVDVIRQAGLCPGIWTNVSITNPDFAAHSPFIFRDQAQNPIICDWLGYCLNLTHDCLSIEVRPLYDALKQIGYEYFKVDSLRHMLLDGLRFLVSQGLLTNEQANSRMVDLMKTIRQAIGDDHYLLACWGVLSETIGTVDACRVGTDANPSWRAVRMQIYETARWFFSQRILFTIDPDHICVRASLPLARSLITLTSLGGGLLMISDRPEHYDPDRIDIVRRSLPPLGTVTAETGQPDYTVSAWALDYNLGQKTSTEPIPFGSLWSFHICSGGQRWSVIERIAIDPLQAADISLDLVGLNPDLEYLAYDFWREEFLGIIRNRLSMHALELGDCQLVGLRRLVAYPCVLASDRHVSMDAVSIKQEQWQHDGHILRISVQGFVGQVITYVFWIPSQWQLVDLQDIAGLVNWRLDPVENGDRHGSDQGGSVLHLSIHFSTPAFDICLRFT